jgi:hypothetical protein
VVDRCLQELLDTVDSVNGRWLVTSDHGNADDMVQRTKKGAPIFDEGRPVPLTSHTLAPVGVAIGGAGLPESVQVPPPSCPPLFVCMHVCLSVLVTACLSPGNGPLRAA